MGETLNLDLSRPNWYMTSATRWIRTLSIADRVVSAISWPWVRAATNALSVFGFASAHDLVTTYPWIGNSSVAPWFRSDRVTTPYCCSAAVANGSGMAAAATLPAASAAAITGNGIGWVGKRTEDSLIPFSVSTEAASR